MRQRRIRLCASTRQETGRADSSPDSGYREDTGRVSVTRPVDRSGSVPPPTNGPPPSEIARLCDGTPLAARTRRERRASVLARRNLARGGKFGYAWRCGTCASSPAIPKGCSQRGTEARRGETYGLARKGGLVSGTATNAVPPSGHGSRSLHPVRRDEPFRRWAAGFPEPALPWIATGCFRAVVCSTSSAADNSSGSCWRRRERTTGPLLQCAAQVRAQRH